MPGNPPKKLMPVNGSDDWHDYGKADENGSEKSFKVKYAGLVPEIGSDIDPSGRTDLLKILDQAEINGHISILGYAHIFPDDATMEINYDAVTVQDIASPDVVQLVVPLHMIASVGYVREDALNIVTLRIGEIDGDTDVQDLAVFYTKTAQMAEEICTFLGACFQFIYRESFAINSEEAPPKPNGKFPTLNGSPPTSSSNGTASSLNSPAIDHHSTTTTVTSGSSRKTVELINDYITMLSSCLTHEELNKFAVLMKRWRAKEMPIMEFAQKLMELYGEERKHLLARLRSLLRDVCREDLEAFSDFLCANGVTEQR